MKKTVVLPFVFLLISSSAHASLNVDGLPPKQNEIVTSIRKKLAPVMEERDQKGTSPILTFEELYAPLEKKEKKFLDEMQKLKPEKVGVKTPYLGIAKDKLDLEKIEGQKIKKDGKTAILPTQYLPKEVFTQYEKMMKAMEKGTGKRLYISSGFRSPAYQLYNFIYYMPKRGNSIRATARWNALPGYSEHGWPPQQAIDFVTENGINDDSKPEEWEPLEEFKWLQKNAAKYGFELSYPKKNPHGISYEPWHWRFNKKLLSEKEEGKSKKGMSRPEKG